jgi:dihydrofolate reductase
MPLRRTTDDVRLRLSRIQHPDVHRPAPEGAPAAADVPRRRYGVARLIYSAIASLDGYVEDQSGSFEWAAPDAEVHAFVNDLERPIGTYLYGRRMYETMLYWETLNLADEPSAVARDFAQVWRAADKIVFSRTLDVPSSARTRVEHDLDPAAIGRLKQASVRDLTIGGAELAGQVVSTGLIDEYHLFLCPVVVGGGKPALPHDVRIRLDLLDEHHFHSGVVYLRYRVGAALPREGRRTDELLS